MFTPGSRRYCSTPCTALLWRTIPRSLAFGVFGIEPRRGCGGIFWSLVYSSWGRGGCPSRLCPRNAFALVGWDLMGSPVVASGPIGRRLAYLCS